jgi:ubiquinone/menaquinone biosynthesis C-methylase UbiE
VDPLASEGFARAATIYERGRPGYPTEGINRAWEGLGLDARAEVLDLAAGTGKLTRALLTRAARVIAVEPLPEMRAALAAGLPEVAAVDGTAEQLPLDDGSCDATLMSDVAHHLRDQDACVRELVRVLRPGGRVLARGILPRSLPRVRFLDFFPAAQPLAEEQSQALARFAERLAAAGFESVADEALEQELGRFREYYDKVKLRAISTLELISVRDFEVGIERMEEAADSDEAEKLVIEQIDLLVFRA